MDQEMLHAISDLLDQKLEPVHDRLEGLETRFDGLETKVDRLDERVVGIELTLENDIKPNIKILAEGVMQNTERIERIEKKVEKLDGIEANVDALMAAVKSHSNDIEILKAVK